MPKTTYRHIFGPVPSRRLGRSLGIDLVPAKTCSLDCVYCEAGRTTRLTTERRAYVPIAEVMAELDRFLRSPHEPIDHLTFSGSGEPLLHTELGELASWLKRKYPQYRLALLTNGLAFADPRVVDEVRAVDLICPSFDATDEAEFEQVNHPAPGVDFKAYCRGLIDLCRRHPGQVFLEYFIVPGVNDGAASLARLAGFVSEARPDRVQLNTLDRPGTVADLPVSSPENTLRLVRALEGIVPVEAIGSFRYRTFVAEPGFVLDDDLNELVNLVRRRPGTAADLAESCGCPAVVLEPKLERLVANGVLQASKLVRGVFYRVPA